MPIRAAGIRMLAWTLTGVAGQCGCGADEVPLEVLGYWLVHRHSFPRYLDVPWEPELLACTGETRENIEQAARVVVHGWLTQVGRLRLGDHVVITPESLVRHKEPRRGMVISAGFLNPDEWRGLAPGRLTPDPAHVDVLLDEPEADEEWVSREHPWGLLLDEEHHRDEPQRALAIHTYSAIRDLSLAGSLVRMQGPQRTRAYLERRARFYPARVADILHDAAAMPDLDPEAITMLALRLP